MYEASKSYYTFRHFCFLSFLIFFLSFSHSVERDIGSGFGFGNGSCCPGRAMVTKYSRLSTTSLAWLVASRPHSPYWKTMAEIKFCYVSGHVLFMLIFCYQISRPIGLRASVHVHDFMSILINYNMILILEIAHSWYANHLLIAFPELWQWIMLLGMDRKSKSHKVIKKIGIAIMIATSLHVLLSHQVIVRMVLLPF